MTTGTTSTRLIALTQGERAIAEALERLAGSCAQQGDDEAADRVRRSQAEHSVDATRRLAQQAERAGVALIDHESTDFGNPLNGAVEFHGPADPPNLEKYATFLNSLAAERRSHQTAQPRAEESP